MGLTRIFCAWPQTHINSVKTKRHFVRGRRFRMVLDSSTPGFILRAKTPFALQFCLDRRRVLLFASQDLFLFGKMNADILAKAKSLGFSDRQIANLTGKSEDEVRALRKKFGLVPSYRLVDTCA